MNNGHPAFVLRKSVRKIKRVESQKNQNNRAQAIQCMIPQKQSSKKDLLRETLSNFSTNSAHHMSALNRTESKHRTDNVDHQQVFLNFCNRSTPIRELLQKQNFSFDNISKIAFVVISKFGPDLANHQQIQSYIAESIKKHIKRSKCEQNCTKRQSKIDRLINDRIYKLEAFLQGQ